MSIVVTVTRPEPCFDPLLPFDSVEGKQVLSLFQEGAPLREIRDEEAGRTFVLELNEKQLRLSEESPLVPALQCLATTGYAPGPAGSDVAVVETWSFAPEKLGNLKQRWRQATLCAKDWQSKKGRLSKKPVLGLSEKALAALRTLKRQYALCMYPELFDVWEELNRAGLVEVNPNGGVKLDPKAREVEVPWGSFLKLKPADRSDTYSANVHPPIVVEVKPPVQFENPLERFSGPAGQSVLELFKTGAHLVMDRRARPASWTLVHLDGRVHHFGRDVGTALALKAFGTSVEFAARRAHGESWAFCPAKFAIAKLEWASALECAEDWGASAGPLNNDTRDLSGLAQATLRTLQQKLSLPMHAELFGAFLELNSKGYLKVHARGYAELQECAKDVFVVAGPRIEIKVMSQ